MQDSVSRLKDLFVDKAGSPLAFYLPPQCIDDADLVSLEEDLAAHGGTLCRSVSDADIILADPRRLDALDDTQPHHVVLDKRWVDICLVAKGVLGADTNWANQVLRQRGDCSQSKRYDRPLLRVSTSTEKLTLPSIHDLGLLKDDVTTQVSSIRRSGASCTQTSAVLQSCYAALDDASGRPPSSVYRGQSPRYGSPRLREASPAYVSDGFPRPARKHEASRRDDWRYPSSPLYRRPYEYAAPERLQQGHRGYRDPEYQRDGSNGFEYAGRREHDRSLEERGRIAPPRYPSRHPDPLREDKHFGRDLHRPKDELYYAQLRDDRYSPPNKRSPRSYAHLPEKYAHESPGPSWSSSSPEDKAYPETPEKSVPALHIIPYQDPSRLDPSERPSPKVYRGGYPVESKAVGMTKPTYIMSDGKPWHEEHPEPPPPPEAPPEKEKSKRHKQYSEADDWFIVNYANWIMRREPKIEMKELYARIQEKMIYHTYLALYLRVNKSKPYFRRLGMVERALSRRVQTSSGRKKKALDPDLLPLGKMSLLDKS
ncbi:hypothetical protein CALCODRAFT_482523 [Calocera cornea HHB12733]|uniref:BRCT domain-containing protein n=1 Tax=Calocera cornea HHB12733 TaxID=1353952 RepID=A0A165GN47_9BASI|nr:hypothetical protein CALCODRAFT_482523 [Calocera cornea HHB12733]